MSGELLSNVGRAYAQGFISWRIPNLGTSRPFRRSYHLIKNDTYS